MTIIIIIIIIIIGGFYASVSWSFFSDWRQVSSCLAVFSTILTILWFVKCKIYLITFFFIFKLIST